MSLNLIGFILIKRKISFSSLAGIKRTRRKFFFNDTNSQFQSIYAEKYLNNYEPEVFWTIKTFLDKNSVFIDVGANWDTIPSLLQSIGKPRLLLLNPIQLYAKILGR